MDIADDTVARSRVSKSLFLKKSDFLFIALFKRAKERFALCRSFGKEQIALCRSFCKERKRKLHFVALFKRASKKKLLFVALFKREKELFDICCSFSKEQIALLEKSERANRSLSLFSKNSLKYLLCTHKEERSVLFCSFQRNGKERNVLLYGCI